MKNIIITLIVGVLFLSVFSIVLPVKICDAAVTITVGPGGSPTYDYADIQDAIDAANESGGDIINVYSGTYNEYLTIDKSLTLTGAGSGTKSISGSDEYKHTIEVTANDVSISGFTIDNSVGMNNHKSGVFLSSSENCEISNNIINNADSGIYITTSISNTINGNIIENNIAQGITITASSNNELHGNTIQNNNQLGVYISSGSSSNEIYQNTITGNNGYGLRIVASNNNILYKNDFSENGGDNANDAGSNSWSYNSEGNYWDDYTGEDANDDGIGDTPYDIPGGGGNQDLYPIGYFTVENQQPVAAIQSISPNPATYGQTISFNGFGTDDGSIIAWEWKVDGVIKSNSEDFTYSGFSVGTHSATFRVQDNDYLWSPSVSETFTITQSSQQNQAPTVTIIHPEPSKTANYGEPFYFYGIAQDPDPDDSVSFSWSSNKDGFLSGQESFYKSDLTVGIHTITCRVTDNHGAYSEESRSLIITPDPTVENDPPTADAGGPYTGSVDSSVSFDGSGSFDSDEDDSITDYDWDFGDGHTGTGMSTEHTYTVAGEYQVELTVTDTHGEQSVSTVVVNISAESNNGQNGGNGGSDDKNDKWVIPGFELGFIIIAIGLFIFWKKIKRK